MGRAMVAGILVMLAGLSAITVDALAFGTRGLGDVPLAIGLAVTVAGLVILGAGRRAGL